jgi:hypothetical protein
MLKYFKKVSGILKEMKLRITAYMKFFISTNFQKKFVMGANQKKFLSNLRNNPVS